MQPDALFSLIMDTIKARGGERVEDFTFPPNVFLEMGGKFLEYSQETPSLTTQFPVLDKYMNPYGAMQGGMIAAAVDNTIGPLSSLLSPINVTRKLEITYSQPVTLDLGHILVYARLVNTDGRRLFFEATVRSLEGKRLARAKATHWIVEDS